MEDLPLQFEDACVGGDKDLALCSDGLEDSASDDDDTRVDHPAGSRDDLRSGQRVAEAVAAPHIGGPAAQRKRQSHHEAPQDRNAAGPKNFSHFEAGEF